jgi:hypothetical protein
MTNKERFIKTIKETKKSTGCYDDCKLCQMVGKINGNMSCKPCPLSSEYEREDCWNALSILEWPTNKKERDRLSYYKRTIIKMLEETPARCFTEESWCYFRKLHKYVDKVYEKIKQKEV